MGNIYIITNNSLALGKYPQISESVDGGPAEVFQTARGRIHAGARLINHPLSGSVKPNQSPYKSLVLSAEEGKVVDFASLAHIEAAFEALRKLPQLDRRYDQHVLEDFKVIDLDLLDSAIKALPAEYHF